MSRVLVVGATGLLGSAAFAEIAKRGHEVHGVARHVDQHPELDQLDLHDLVGTTDFLAGLAPDVVVQMTAGNHGGDVSGLVSAYLLPTLNLAIASSQVKRPPALIIAGSAAEYGATEPGQRAVETSKLNPMSGYGWVKASETSMALSLAGSRGLTLTVVRPFNIISPSLTEATALGNFRRQILNGSGSVREVRCGRIDIVRDYVTTTFVGEVVAELTDYRYEGVVNICSGKGIELRRLLSAVGELMDVEVRFDIDPALAAIPAVTHIVGDPSLLYSMVEARGTTDTHELARALLGSVA